ncbi:MAG: GNAT family N-acetyltransferase [Paracoccus sp. (in: a-proteobacteria)]
MSPEDLAQIHAACFTRPRPWSAEEFAALLADSSNFLISRPQGFLIGRTILDEAELLTLAVAPEVRRRGSGAALLAAFETEAVRRGAKNAFLEVAHDNQPALCLYARSCWYEAGRRRGYYGDGIDALILRKDT